MSILSNTLQAAAKVYALESQGVQEAQEDNVSVESQPPFTTQLRWNSAMAVPGHSQAGACPQSSPICSNSFAEKKNGRHRQELSVMMQVYSWEKITDQSKGPKQWY